MSTASPLDPIPATGVPHVLAFNRVLHHKERHRLSLRESRVHSTGAVLVLDRVFRRLPDEEQLAYRRALMDSYAAGEGGWWRSTWRGPKRSSAFSPTKLRRTAAEATPASSTGCRVASEQGP